MLQNDKGYTLVEVIVALTIMVILIGSIIALVNPVLSIFNKTIDLADDQSVALNVADILAHKVQYARSIEVGEDGKSLIVDGVEYKTENGYLVEKNHLVFDTAYYGGAKVDVTFEYTEPIVKIYVVILREDRQKFTHELSCKPYVYVGKEEDEYGYEDGDLAFEDENGRRLYLSGTWAQAKAEAAKGPGILLTNGTVYRDHTGIFVVVRIPYLHDYDAIRDITLAEMAGVIKIDPTANIMTDEDYDFSAEYWINPPVEGSIFERNGKLYVCGYPSGKWTTINVESGGVWIEIIQKKK